MQIGRHSQTNDSIEDGESFWWRDLGNCRVFDNAAATGREELNFELGGLKPVLVNVQTFNSGFKS